MISIANALQAVDDMETSRMSRIYNSIDINDCFWIGSQYTWSVPISKPYHDISNDDVMIVIKFIGLNPDFTMCVNNLSLTY